MSMPDLGSAGRGASGCLIVLAFLIIITGLPVIFLDRVTNPTNPSSQSELDPKK